MEVNESSVYLMTVTSEALSRNAVIFLSYLLLSREGKKDIFLNIFGWIILCPNKKLRKLGLGIPTVLCQCSSVTVLLQLQPQTSPEKRLKMMGKHANLCDNSAVEANVYKLVYQNSRLCTCD